MLRGDRCRSGSWKIAWSAVLLIAIAGTAAHGLPLSLYWMAGCTCVPGNTAIVGFDSPIMDNNALRATAAKCVNAQPNQINIIVNYGASRGLMEFDGTYIPCPQ
jgi:hypothetical protein